MSRPPLDLIIPPIIALVSIGGIIGIFRHARRRNSVAHGNSEPLREGLGHLDGARSVASDVPAHSGGIGNSSAQGTGIAENEPIVEREKMLIKRITANPRDVEAYELLGRFYVAQNNLTDAIECFEQVIAFMPEHLRAIEQIKRIKKMMADTHVAPTGREVVGEESEKEISPKK